MSPAAPTAAGNGGPKVRVRFGAAQRSLRFFGAHRLVADVALVLALAALTSADPRRGTDLRVAALFTLALWIPVVFRRRAPVVVFIVVGAVAFVQWLLSVPLGGDLAVLVALYTVAAKRPRNLAIAAAAAAEFGVVLAVIRFAGDHWPRFLLLLTMLVIAAVLLGITQQARRVHLAALVDRAARLERERDQQAQLATAAERARIAREIHDIVAHSLSVMITVADGAALTEQIADARAAMRQVASTGREALADTRRVLDVLRDDDEQAQRRPVPGLSELDSLLTNVRATGLHTTLTVCGSVFPVPGAAQNAIYRIVQEALTNTVKHARDADYATVTMTYRHPEIGVDIADNGGPPAPLSQFGGHGLLGLRERVALFDGQLHAGPGKQGGWKISATLSLPGTSAPATSAPASSPPGPAAAAHRPAAATSAG